MSADLIVISPVAAPRRCAPSVPGGDHTMLTALLTAQQRVFFKAKERIFQEHDGADHVFLIERGTVLLHRSLPAGRRLISRFLFAGDMIGLAFNTQYPVTAECVTPVIACQLSQELLNSLSEHSPALQSDVASVLKAELTRERDNRFPLMHLPAASRVASLLRTIARRNCSDCRKGTLIQLFMTRSDIADYLGLTHETVSRSFKKFKKAGVISEPLPNQIRIENADRLMSLALGNQE